MKHFKIRKIVSVTLTSCANIEKRRTDALESNSIFNHYFLYGVINIDNSTPAFPNHLEHYLFQLRKTLC